MIPLENQVCTLEQAKILKDEFGLDLDSYFAWYLPKFKQESKWHICSVENARYYISKYLISKYYPAPSCAELGVLLPGMIPVEGDSVPVILTLYKCSLNGKFTFEYYEDAKEAECLASSKEGYEAQAKADLLIDGLRKGYIKPEDLKL